LIRILIISVILKITCSDALYAQDVKPKTLYDFRLYEGATEGMDLTEWLLENEMHTIFYIFESDSVPMLANVSHKSKSQSFGKLTFTKEPQFYTSDEGNESTVYYFDWEYINSYDDETGIAKVKAIITAKPDATYLTMHIVPNDLKLIIYKGITEGEPDL
jgi:hypothetical protein